MTENTFTGKRVFVTGATGFLGGALAKRLIGEGAELSILARSVEKAAHLAAQGVKVTIGKLSDDTAVEEAMRDCEIVFHVAAATTGAFEAQWISNVEGTRTVMDAAAELRPQRVVHVSTISVYGNHHFGNVSEDQAPGIGLNPYLRSKWAAENVVRDISTAHDLEYAIIRPGMIYGAGSSMWTRTLFQLARRNPLPFFGDGSGHAYPIHVDDVVDMMSVLAHHPEAKNEAFNCTPDPSPTWKEFLLEYAQYVGHQNWLSLPMPLAYGVAGATMAFSNRNSIWRDLPDMINLIRYPITFKMDKALHLLDWSPKVDLHTGIASCIPWLRAEGLLR